MFLRVWNMDEMLAVIKAQGLTLVNCSAQRNHFICDKLGGFSDESGSA
jgi:hypothetical protein